MRKKNANSKNPVRACLILHKKSCNKPEVSAAVDHIKGLGVDLDVHIPWSGKELHRFVRQVVKDGVGRIVAGGGDGTVNAVVNAMIRKDKRPEASLGVLPLGTANDFATGIGIDARDLATALELACTGRPTTIDVGWMNQTYFVNVASAGFGAEITATTPKDLKKALGGLAYSIMGFIQAFKLKPYSGRLILPDGVAQEGSMLLMAIGNSRFAGGGYEVAPRASLNDGLLDVAIVSGHPPHNLDQLRAELKDPMNPRNELLVYRQLAAFTMESDEPLHVNLDGEPVTGTRFEFRCCRNAVSVVLGKSARGPIDPATELGH
jgi:lipid kinase YegS